MIKKGMANKDNHRQKGNLPHSLVYNLGSNHTQSSKSFGYYGEKRLVSEKLTLNLSEKNTTRQDL